MRAAAQLGRSEKTESQKGSLGLAADRVVASGRRGRCSSPPPYGRCSGSGREGHSLTQRDTEIDTQDNAQARVNGVGAWPADREDAPASQRGLFTCSNRGLGFHFSE